MGKGRRKLFEIFFILLIINIGLVGVPSAYAGISSGDPVCGNDICETGEDKTCPQDCSSAPVDCSVEEDDTPCDDGNSCTQDTCQANVCVGKALEDGLTCSDGNSCTIGGVCSAGTCEGSKNSEDGTTCNDGDLCTSDSVCKTGTCGSGSPISCDDADVCTADSCDPAKGCLNPPVADGTLCDDGLFCSAEDICSGGVCKSASATCASNETCDESSESCIPNPTCSTDADCAQGEVCSAAICVPAPSSCTLDTDCASGEVCEAATCVPAPGCTSDADCASGQVCDTNTATCIQEETKQTSGEVNILETCGLAFVSGNPVAYPPVLPGGISDPEQLLVLDNTGNVVAILLVKGGDWVDGGNNKIMNVGDTKYAITTPQDYATQKIALTGADVVVTAAFDPVVDQNTYWQLQANLLNNNFAGDLTQTMDFTVSC